MHLWRTQLVELTWNTVRLLAGVGAGTLVRRHRSRLARRLPSLPRPAVLEWALVLPLAMPAYVIGFACLGLFDFAGPVQSALRRAFGEGLRLPEIRSYGGVTLMMITRLLPLRLSPRPRRVPRARRARRSRRRGASAARASVAFLRVTLPLARPSLVAGVALAMMEALADFGTVATFGYRTYTEAIYRVWHGMFDRIAATQLASVLLLFAFALLLLERSSRGRQRFTQDVAARTHDDAACRSPAGARGRPPRRALPSSRFAFLLPVGQLAWWGIEAVREGRVSRDFLVLLANTLFLASLAAAAACVFALVLAYAGRLHPSPGRPASRGSSRRWAMRCPGSVIAVGVLLPLAWVDHSAGALLERVLGRPVGSLPHRLGARPDRRLRRALPRREPADGGREPDPVSPILDDAARSLGARAGGVLRRVHLPMIRGGTRHRPHPRLRRDHEGDARDAAPAALRAQHAVRRGVGADVRSAVAGGRRPRARDRRAPASCPVILAIRWTRASGADKGPSASLAPSAARSTWLAHARPDLRIRSPRLRLRLAKP